jgi:8-oxo-dGTP diphosphatase
VANAFESGARKAIPAVLVYVFDRGGDGVERVLMVHRNAADRPGDYHAGKWNGLGGKCEPDESFREAARRELREESGLDLPAEALRELGFLQFPNFKAHRAEDWLVTVFVADLPPGERGRKLAGPEGELHWVPVDDLLELNLWAGDRHFIPHLARREPFFGTIWYAGQEVLRHDVRAWR